MIALVTGAAGFIGSTLCDDLLGRGWNVRAVDSLTDYYSRERKLLNLSRARQMSGFEFLEQDICTASPEVLLDGVSDVFHLAGQPGVRSSWRSGFDAYVVSNVLATQRLLEACTSRSIRSFVYASSSSVYGNAAEFPVAESDPTLPMSPYGVTKLAGEHLCSLYGRNFGVPTASLRFFTVYGPRQRPDMATYRMIEAALDGTPFPLFGSGEKIRDFTFVGDISAALVMASQTKLPPATVFNVSGGSSVTVDELIRTVSEVVGREIVVDQQPEASGDVLRTGGSTDRLREATGWAPQTDLRSGIEAQVRWHRTDLREP